MKYAVITYIFGKNTEHLKEPMVLDSNVEYICVTDQKDLCSKNWKIIYEPMTEIKSNRDKVVYVKFNPFKYSTAEKICVIDGTLEIKKSLIPLFEQVKENDILVKKHPERNNLFVELQEWIKTRGMPKSALMKFQTMAEKHNIDLHRNYLLEGCIIVYNKTENTLNLCNDEITYLNFLGENGSMFYSNQCVLTFLTEINKIKLDYLNQKDYFVRYLHNSKTQLADR